MIQRQIQNPMYVDWANINKIRLNNVEDSFQKHEHVKLEVVRLILQKYRKKKNYQEVYTEYALNGKISDVLHKNKLTNEIIAYEIEKNLTKEYAYEIGKYYESLGIDLVIIDLDKISNDLEVMKKQVKELII